ncbi:MAG: hypothetical protein RLZ98_3176 [Pseudomonadota bacterium]|jgi:invasion protein IalB
MIGFQRALVVIFPALALLWCATASAQPLTDHKVEARHGDWQVVCKPPASGSSRICGLVQNVMAEDRSNVGLVIQFQQYDGGARAIRIFAPLGVLLPQGLRVKLDDNDVCFGKAATGTCLPFPFLRCTPDACIAQIAIGDDLLGKLKTSKTAVFIVYQTEEAGIGIPISMNGFSKAYEALAAK